MSPTKKLINLLNAARQCAAPSRRVASEDNFLEFVNIETGMVRHQKINITSFSREMVDKQIKANLAAIGENWAIRNTATGTLFMVAFAVISDKRVSLHTSTDRLF